jgi:molybdopterin-guanine dinucleotide biosynthesis protein A
MIATKITVVIMAGGKSSRMGQDKSFVLFAGRPMIEVIQERVTGLGDELILVTNKPEEYAFLGLPMVSDVYPDHGSLGGIYTAVYHASYPHTLVVACDMPWLNRPLLEYMLTLRQTADVIIPRWQQHPEPLHAIYNKACLAPIEANLQAKRLKITGFFDKVQVHYVERAVIEKFDANGRSFANINTPDELQEAQVNRSQ